MDTEAPDADRPAFTAAIRTARWVLDAPEVAGALALSDLGDWLRAGACHDRAYVEEQFRAWLDEHRPERWTAFNLDFDARFLSWIDLPPTERCLMLWPQEVIDRADPDWLPKISGGRSKWPRASEAATWLRGRGHAISDGQEHRALTDARREADILVALMAEGRR